MFKLTIVLAACLLGMTLASPIGKPRTTEMTLNARLVSPNDHYEDPNAGPCGSDEMNVSITSVPGSFCSPSCSSSTPCPTDYPAGTTAKGECVLEMQGQSQPTRCALICQPGKNDQCPKNASCKSIQSVGVCTYDS